MISDTIVDLCDAVSELAAERNEYRRKLDRLTDQLADQESSVEARAGLADACTELTDLRAKLALQTQIAEGATQQRDEQTARLKDAQAEIVRLRAERDALAKEREAWLDEDARWMARVVGLEVEVRKLTEERDAQTAKLVGANAVIERLAAERDALKASKPTVDVEALDNLAYNTYWATPGNTEVTLRAVVRAVVARLGLTPAAPHDGRVSTNELTKEEVAFARGDGVLVVSDDGLGSVPREWYERAKKARAKTGEVGT